MSDFQREDSVMPDGRRKRRFSTNAARRRWYALHRSRRFTRRFGWPHLSDSWPQLSASRPQLPLTAANAA